LISSLNDYYKRKETLESSFLDSSSYTGLRPGAVAYTWSNTVQGWIFGHTKEETEKTDRYILFPWHIKTIISNNTTAAWFDPPPHPPLNPKP
jgi:hypothetical protein